MNALIVAPIVLPAIVAALTVLARGRRRREVAALSVVSCVALLGIALRLLASASSSANEVYAVGDWPAPFGIVLVLDRLAALMVVLTAVLALVVLCHALLTGVDRRGWHFHPLFQFLLTGLNGAFLTGDLFNLFVFFEVLLIASYGLMLHGQGPARLQAGVQYVVVNLVGSILFLIGVGTLYGVTGTLNMADMAVRMAALPVGDQGLARVGALLLTVVFALKAALLPLHLWLPRTYANTSPVAAALFAIMTKVGVYAIIRTTTLIFGAELVGPLMLPAAIATVVVGFVGVLAARTLHEQAAFGVVGSTGVLLIAVALFEPQALAAGLYYLPHTTLTGALLFLVADLVARRRADHGDAITAGPRFASMGPIAVLYLLAGIALAGMPPLSGFIGKLLILKAAVPHPAAGWIWATILGTTLLAVIALARTGSMLFWKSGGDDAVSPSAGASRLQLVPCAVLVMMLAGLVVGAGGVTGFMDRVAAQVFAPQQYIAAVLGSGGR